MPVFSRTVSDPQFRARVALFDIPAHRRRPTPLDQQHHLELLPRHPVLLLILSSILPKYVRYRELGLGCPHCNEGFEQHTDSIHHLLPNSTTSSEYAFCYQVYHLSLCLVGHLGLQLRWQRNLTWSLPSLCFCFSFNGFELSGPAKTPISEIAELAGSAPASG
jgi:hypothetical protein